MQGWILTSGAFLEDAHKYMGDFESKISIAKVVLCSDVTYTVENGGVSRLWLKNELCQTPDFFLFLDDVSDPVAALANQLIKLGVCCYTPVEAKKRAASKIATNQAMVEAGLPVAKTMVISKSTNSRLIIENLGLPLIIKPDDGSGALDVKLIDTEEELECAINGIHDTGILLAQEFIATSRGRDLRVQVVGYEAVYAVEKSTKNPEDFRSFVKGVGGNLSDVELTAEIKELSAKVAKAIGLRYCGIDLLYGPDGFIVGEVNSSPGVKVSLLDSVFKLITKDIGACLEEHKRAKSIDN